MTKHKVKNSIAFISRAAVMVLALSFTLFAQGKNPLILIPGMTGSELRHKDTSERIWVKAFKSKAEDLRLPVVADPTKMHDDLIATDVMRNVKIALLPIYDVYGDFINAMEMR